jgi:hypothetical protein
VEDIVQMVIPIGAGDTTITARFAETSDRRMGNGISLATLVALGLILTRTQLAERRSV